MDSLTLVMLAVLAVLVFFMFRNGRKRKKDQEALQATMVPGADVMTNFGMYGTIIAIDEEANKVELQIAPGVVVEIHRQTIARVVEPVVVDVSEGSSVDSIDSLTEPEFGQRVADVDTDTTEQPKKGDA
ncbi:MULTISPECIES: preprotein translocase subunit YajC [unclassified Cryobacterium]|uniref:preprotein translocase subunit YajC n=1 Tax=unclassified Cryobacterium TaxID=2649013 RepID=UPI000CE39049|nr:MULTISPECIES: preprotein translocase subunit YajC [unclassified Cryobacterium]TFD67477.1 preprotein translocase subunit YajC [Cryobacterium sp. Hb1]